jgi:hypothetical protein
MLEIALSKNAGLRRVVIMRAAFRSLRAIVGHGRPGAVGIVSDCNRIAGKKWSREQTKQHTENNGLHHGNAQNRQKMVIPASLEIVKMLRR